MNIPTLSVAPTDTAPTDITPTDITSTEVEIPGWLKDCIQSQYQASPSLPDDQASESTPTDDKPETNEQLIGRAFTFAYKLHEGQYRKSGEPYIAHPVAVAGLLRELGGDSAMIAAGFLHDVVEDTAVKIEEIETLFGSEVAQLVEGVTKLSKFNFSSKTERQAENFRRMFLAMAKDIRVIVVKLADRLHNMRTLEHLKPEKQQRIARETREIFAPLANRLGIGRFKWELEDLCFKYLEPEAYREIQSFVAEKRTDREARIKRAVTLLNKRLQAAKINITELKGRPKHLFGIYSKMQRQNKAFHEIFDIAALRIIVSANEECYRALAIVHDVFRPIPGRFKDYIGLPKPNRYQSLHTSVVGLNGRPLEVQIRTQEMHQIAEYGIAAHWKYKETNSSSHTDFTAEDEKLAWLRQLLDWQQELQDAQEYVDNLKDNFFVDDVYVFTPKGDVIALARGATPVDFAYRIHTEVGNHMKGARVNDQWTVLDRPLQNGDIVEIITQKNCRPSLDWLNFAVTPSARNRIRQWYKRSRREENLARGRGLLEKELGKNGLDALLKSEQMLEVAKRCNYQNAEDLQAGLGYGEVTLKHVVNRLQEIVKAQQTETGPAATTLLPDLIPNRAPNSSSKRSSSPIAGIEGLLHYIAGCCRPLPGEPIIGIVTRGARGIAIHRQGCTNVEQVPGDRILPVSWNTLDQKGRPQTYPVDIHIETIDRVGVFKDILLRLSDLNINVRNAGVKTKLGQPALITLSIDIKDRQQLEDSLCRIRNMSDILNVRRVDQSGN